MDLDEKRGCRTRPRPSSDRRARSSRSTPRYGSIPESSSRRRHRRAAADGAHPAAAAAPTCAYLSELAARYGYVFYISRARCPARTLAYWGPPIAVWRPAAGAVGQHGPGHQRRRRSASRYDALAPRPSRARCRTERRPSDPDRRCRSPTRAPPLARCPRRSSQPSRPRARPRRVADEAAEPRRPTSRRRRAGPGADRRLGRRGRRRSPASWTRLRYGAPARAARAGRRARRRLQLRRPLLRQERHAHDQAAASTSRSSR